MTRTGTTERPTEDDTPSTMAWICAGLRDMHDDRARAAFIERVWRDRAALQRLTAALDIFEPDSLPVFMLGGASGGRPVIVAVNPGESIDGEQERVQGDLACYQALHESAFVEIPALLAAARARAATRGAAARRQKATSPFWVNLHRYLRVVAPPQVEPTDESTRWAYYTQSCVVQDLIPFHSRSAAKIPLDLTGGLAMLADAVFDGIARSQARCALAFTRQGYRSLRHWAAARDAPVRELTFAGLSRKGKRREVKAFTTRLGEVPALAVDNALISQPAFPWDNGYREQMAAVVREW